MVRAEAFQLWISRPLTKKQIAEILSEKHGYEITEASVTHMSKTDSWMKRRRTIAAQAEASMDHDASMVMAKNRVKFMAENLKIGEELLEAIRTEIRSALNAEDLLNLARAFKSTADVTDRTTGLDQMNKKAEGTSVAVNLLINPDLNPTPSDDDAIDVTAEFTECPPESQPEAPDSLPPIDPGF